MKNALFVLPLLFLSIACNTVDSKNTDNKTATQEPNSRSFQLPSLYPEGIEYDPTTNHIYLGSMSGQAIVRIDKEGNSSTFGESSAPLGSIGLEIDAANRRLIACYSDRNQQMETPVSEVRIFDLETGQLLQRLDLAPLIDAAQYQANDATVTADGTLIISDRKGNALYKIDSEYNATVFYQNEEELKMPNGLAYHPDDFILVAHSKGGPKLCKFPFQTPEEKQDVQIEDERFQGFDGLLLVDNNTLVGVSTVKNEKNKDALIELTTTDNWTSATVSNYRVITPSTTVALVETGHYYVLNQDFKTPAAKTIVVESVRF
jgi:sugar lactone lactonase YvrE